MSGTTDQANGTTPAADHDVGLDVSTKALESVVHNEHIHSHDHKHIGWLSTLIPGAEKLAVKAHAGNFVAERDKSQPPGSKKFFESMPIYVRIGMHLLFYGKEQVKLLEHAHKLENALKEQTVKQGKLYETAESTKSIPNFVQTYKIKVEELEKSDLNSYKNFNEFFYRTLKPGMRPTENPAPEAYCCAADSRVTVYESVSEAQKFWIKGDEFTLTKLLYGADQSKVDPTLPLEDASLAIFRLAPADYHRFHSPADAEILSDPLNIDGKYFTVNPEAVNEEKLDVFTANKRQVTTMRLPTGDKMAFVAIGALLVGAINWTKSKGSTLKKGDDLGYFAYGGSTCIAVFPKGSIKFDDDLVTNSKNRLETLVQVGWSLGVDPRRVGLPA